MSKVRLRLSRAKNLADRVVDELRSKCDRIEIAGSIRREAPIVGDIEILAIPRRRGLLPDFGPSMLDEKLSRLVDSGRLTRDVGGERYKRYRFPSFDGLQLDLWIASPDRWGVLFALRTGPADFSKALVTQRDFGGRLQNDLVVFEGRVWPRESVTLELVTDGHKSRRITRLLPGATPLNTCEELDFLQLAGGWYEPAERRADQPIQHSFNYGNGAAG